MSKIKDEFIDEISLRSLWENFPGNEAFGIMLDNDIPPSLVEKVLGLSRRHRYESFITDCMEFERG